MSCAENSPLGSVSPETRSTLRKYLDHPGSAVAPSFSKISSPHEASTLPHPVGPVDTKSELDDPSHNPGGKCPQLHATRLVRCEVGNCPARLHHKTALPETSETKTVGGASRGGCDSNGRVEMFKVLPSLALGSIDISEKTTKSTDPVFSKLIPRDVDRVESNFSRGLELIAVKQKPTKVISILCLSLCITEPFVHFQRSLRLLCPFIVEA